jgi:hypothetical protein
MAKLRTAHVLVASLVVSAALLGCAHPRTTRAPVVYRPVPPPPPPPPPPPVKKVKLVIFPLDKLALPGTAEELNEKLGHLQIPGVDEIVVASLGMETAQMQAECADPTETCYLKIARLVEADRIMWPTAEKVTTKGRRRSRKPTYKLQLTLFDRDKLAITGHSEETYTGPITAQALDKQIEAVVSAVGTPAPMPAAVPPAGSPPPMTVPPPSYQPAPQAAPAAQPAYAPAARPAAQPAQAYPAQPAQGRPVQAQPGPGYPAQPAPVQPAPAQPAPAGYPAQPAPGYPAQPAPAQPAPGYPAQPAQPAPAYPAPAAQPSAPAPASPSPAQPARWQ